MESSPADLTTYLGRLKLKNPVLLASGTAGYGQEYAPYIDFEKIGGLITKTITPKPKQGNVPPRLAETPCGLLNSIGLENPGVDVFIKKYLPFLQNLPTTVLVSIAGQSEGEYLFLAEKLGEKEAVKALEVNVSCPNVNSGRMIGEDAQLVFHLAKKLREVTDTLLVFKLPFLAGRMLEVSRAAKEAGAQALSLINTIPGMAIDVEEECPKLGNITGGLSGPAIRPVAVKVVWEVYTKIHIPIIGTGGIMGPEDALEFVLAGASAVAVGTANFVDPKVSVRVVEGIENYLHKKNMKRFCELVGSLSIKRGQS